MCLDPELILIYSFIVVCRYGFRLLRTPVFRTGESLSVPGLGAGDYGVVSGGVQNRIPAGLDPNLGHVAVVVGAAFALK